LCRRFDSGSCHHFEDFSVSGGRLSENIFHAAFGLYVAATIS
jgi:hypothetical protein